MLKNLLVHIPSERTLRPVIDCAVSLTASRKAHLDAVAVGYESINPGLVIEGGTAVAAIMEIESQKALDRANAALSVFETEARNAGIDYSCRALCALPGEAPETIGVLSRLYDLAVVSQPDSSQSNFDDYIPKEVLFNSGPVLMVPYIHKGPLDANHVGIAWDGSRLAARAVRDAMPFLAKAKTVTIIAINEDGAGASSSELTTHLARRGIKSQVERTTVAGAHVHSAILSIAAETGLGLLVMGGYGHSRMQEIILGGVTRGMFKSMTVPTLMCH